jgi:hypothetical protein
MPPKFEQAMIALFVSPGALTDAGGYILTPHGIVPVPGWGPEIVADLATAVSVYRQASSLTDSGARRQLEEAANHIVRSQAGAIRDYAKQLGASGVANQEAARAAV